MDDPGRPARHSGDSNPADIHRITMDPPPSRAASTQPDQDLSPETQTSPPAGLYPVTTNPQSQRRPSTIRLRRLPSSIRPVPQSLGDEAPDGRRRSTSAPQRPEWLRNLSRERLSRQATAEPPMSTVQEEPSRPSVAPDTLAPLRSSRPPPTRIQTDARLPPPETQTDRRASHTGPVGRMRSVSQVVGRTARAPISRIRPEAGTSPATADDEYDSRVVDILDVIDPQVSTLSSLTNVQNSLFVPDLGRLVNRRPTYTISPQPRPPRPIPEAETPEDKSAPLTPYITAQEAPKEEAEEVLSEPEKRARRSHSITSAMSDSRYAVLPHGASLEGWTEEDKEMLNDHVRHLLHSRRAAFRRGLKGFGQYVRRPLGFFVTLYATLITLFGLAWVLFLIGWINVGGRQSYIINVIDNVLVALFAIVGDGLAPFRAVDTYHMIYIAHYHHLTWRLRRERALPRLVDENDLPPQPNSHDIGTVAGGGVDISTCDPELAHPREFEPKGEYEFSVLTPKQQANLVHHQTKFAKSHTFYKPHETSTHHAFPLRTLVAVVCLLDCHSLFQIALGACTWGISYHVRPEALTAVILCCSICCNIAGGVTIAYGDRKTRKKDVIERQFRQTLTGQAIKKIQKRKTTTQVSQSQPQSQSLKLNEEKTQEELLENAEGSGSGSGSGSSSDR